MVVRTEPLDPDHLLDAHHRTTVRPFLPFFSSPEAKPNHLVFSSGLKITCSPEEFTVFNPPLGETCANWANDFVQHFGGYLDNPTENALCRYCPVAVGDEYYTPLNMSFGNRWRDVWLIFAFFGMSSPRFPPCLLCSYAFPRSFQRSLGRPRVQVPSLCQTVIGESAATPTTFTMHPANTSGINCSQTITHCILSDNH